MTTKPNPTAEREPICGECANLLDNPPGRPVIPPHPSLGWCQKLRRWHVLETPVSAAWAMGSSSPERCRYFSPGPRCSERPEGRAGERGDSPTGEESEPSVPTKPLEFYDDPDHFPGNQAPSKPDRDRIVEEVGRRFGTIDKAGFRFARAARFGDVADFVLAAAMEEANRLRRQILELQDEHAARDAAEHNVSTEVARLRSRVAELEANEQPTLRDQLAMAVLPQLMAQCDHYYDTHPGAATVTRDDTCGEAYRWADAMMLAKGWTLKARNQPPAESK